MKAIWQILIDLQNALQNSDNVQTKQFLGGLLIAIGNYLINSSTPPVIGAANIDADEDVDRVITAASDVIDQLGGNIPIAAGGEKLARAIELLKVLLPLLVKIL